MADDNPQEPCSCRNIHGRCDPATCAQTSTAWRGDPFPSIRDFRKTAAGGCAVCVAVVQALQIPEVKADWQALIGPALASDRSAVVWGMSEDEELIGVEVDKHTEGLAVIRTKASEESLDWAHFNLWRDGTSDWGIPGCRAISTLPYQPVEQTGSEESLRQLKGWIRNCDENHGCHSGEVPVLPTRVVRVTDNMVKIVTTNGLRARYTTLSHRWGAHEDFTLGTLNSIQMGLGVPWDTIPKTYQDAIEVTRQLELEYIWIDSLCIVQDDPEDWRRESVLMKAVYGNSYLNIAAIDAPDSRDGMFATSNLPRDFPALPVPGCPGVLARRQEAWAHRDFGSHYPSQFNSPVLMMRAWVLQERLLSRRVVYYDARELKWECDAARDCQCGALVTLGNFKLEFSDAVWRRQRDRPLPFIWMRIAERYSNLELTFDSDRAVALAGIAELALRSGGGGRYLAGLWEKHLAHQICWKIGDTYRKPEMYIAPSWSWLSVFGGVEYSNRMDFDACCSVIDVEITEAECTYLSEADQTGPVVDGHLKVSGRGAWMLAELSEADDTEDENGAEGEDEAGDDEDVTEDGDSRSNGDDTGDDGDTGDDDDSEYEEDPPWYCLRYEESGLPLSEKWDVVMDYLMDENEARRIKRVFMLYWGAMADYQHTFLMLKEVPGEVEKFERLGILWLTRQDSEADLDQALDLCKPKKDIIIV
ncbi:HET domain-containing protein [Xylariaceae sp. FL0016]|nr:HET domain-containing protein [Xylariaceae sp. FL0016]